jgi:hypothetical protein
MSALVDDDQKQQYRRGQCVVSSDLTAEKEDNDLLKMMIAAKALEWF